MIITQADGKQETIDLANYYSMIGANFTNIQANDATVTQTLNNLVKDAHEHPSGQYFPAFGQ
jgi:hypothetical protein